MISGSLVGGKYRLIRQIGEGAMGVVWSAVNEMTSRKVAIKFIQRPSDDLRHRLFREAKACGSINHRNIVESLDMGTTSDGDPFLVMQLLSGETLDAILERKRRLVPHIAAQIGRDVARALAAAHEARIIHRDLKPANIFLHQEPGTEGHVVKVLDFGVSKNLAASDVLATIANGAVGTPAYMSPEQYRVAPDLDARTDIWSFGVVLFELLAGVRPFCGSTQEVMVKVLSGEIPLVSRFVRAVEPGLVELVSRCLERDRDARISSASEIAHILNGYAEATEISAVLTEHPARNTEAPPTVIPNSEIRRSRPSYEAFTAQSSSPRSAAAAAHSTTNLVPNSVGRARPTSEPAPPTVTEAPPSVILAIEPATRSGGPGDPPAARPSPPAAKPPSETPLIVVRGPTTSTAPMIRRVREFDVTQLARSLRQEKPDEARASAGRGLLLATLTSLGVLMMTVGVIIYIFVSTGPAGGTAPATPAVDLTARAPGLPASTAPRTDPSVRGAPQGGPSAGASGAPATASSSKAPSSSASAKRLDGGTKAMDAGAGLRPQLVKPSPTAHPARSAGSVHFAPFEL